ncbi:MULTISPECIES: ATP synthase F1 subunit delta [Pseudobutyrivibrio]|jgi:F-type H+-transporting ATPase subunit delta|uniref:ATP synthase subunit delta n=1 Tax=Pseudobutyrivibrio xylanivorans DSM 14809 TaxID=1123012 RepID=A0A1M6H8S4_PSEXY|nr:MULTISPECIES: ATP synthase F1 subunit delta [Pseudobutyrivibrio]SFN74170.1 F-type H+-transporting ATPase subunit delta [Pseudobutyrivibrio sp. UC1225]SHJ18614.1 F-type H+-transporting ATPase subunit delta [Pseudobutyrivibrio xylanivorans DSM 14809]
MAKLVSNVYGDALFELAVETGKVDDFLNEAQGVIEVVKSNDGFSQMMNHPKINKEEKLQIIDDVFKGRVSNEMVGLLRMLEEKDHIKDTVEVLNYFIDRVFDFKKIGRAFVSTPFELTDAQKSDVEKRLLQTTEYSSFVMDYTVDPDLIGGMVIRIKDRVIDSSVKTQISKLSHELSNIQLKVGECAP